MDEKETTKKTKETIQKVSEGRTHHDYRPHNLSVSFSDQEYEKFCRNVKQSGLRKTDFVRTMLTRGHVIQRINDDDKKQINQLSKIGKDLHRLLGAAYKEGLEKHVKWLGEIELNFRGQFENIKKKLQ